MAIKKYENTRGVFYEVNTYCGRDPLTGREIRIHKKGFKTRRAAQIYETDTKRQALSGRLAPAAPRYSLTFADVCNAWLDKWEPTVAQSTAYATAARVKNHIIPAIGSWRLQSVTISDCQRFIDSPAGSVAGVYVNFKQILKYAYQNDYINIDMAAKIKPARKKRTLDDNHNENWFNKGELSVFLDTCKKGNQKYYTLFHLAAFSGLRFQELLALQWCDYAGQTLNVRQAVSRDSSGAPIISVTKTAASRRIIALDPETCAVLDAWRDYSTTPGLSAATDWIFYGRGDMPLTMVSVHFQLRKLCDAAGVKRITPHGFRHTHATMLLDAGVGLKDVKERLGHQNISTTLNYYAHSDAANPAAINQVMNFYKS